VRCKVSCLRSWGIEHAHPFLSDGHQNANTVNCRERDEVLLVVDREHSEGL
jgi:hypothetical protein